MDTRLLILQRLDEICHSRDLRDTGDIQWNDAQLLRSCTIRAQRGDPSGWREFMAHLDANRPVHFGFRFLFEELGWTEYCIEADRVLLTLPSEYLPLDEPTAAELIAFLNPSFKSPEDAEPKNDSKDSGVVKYIEEKRGLTGHARIGRVTYSATRKTIYYAGRKLRSLKGAYKANYYNVDSGLRYWISNCKKHGNDTLYPGNVEIDEDAREEYWTTIRNMPQNVHMTRFRSEGKYAKRRPC